VLRGPRGLAEQALTVSSLAMSPYPGVLGWDYSRTALQC
jgi:hypothetical protein